ncbi:hypothetical protein H7J11_06060 [Mycobacterium bourgelatii]|nr:hypothetical protein [Mycobacterium bourgelatii]
MDAQTRSTVIWNIIGYLFYALLVAAGALCVWVSFFFAMATDACHDSACNASYRVFPAMVTMWIGVATVLVTTLIVMVVKSTRGKVVAGWPIGGLLGLVVVFVLSMLVLH